MEQLIEKAAVLHEALPYIKRFHGRTFVIKYGGHAMVDEALRESFVRDMVLMKFVGINPVVVHGGGPQIDRTLDELGIQSKRVEGLRITDDRTMEVVEMVLAGRVNKEIASLIGQQGGRGVGLSGVDDGLLMAERKGVVQTPSGAEVDIGRVGRVVGVRPGVLRSLIDGGFIPVIAPIGAGRDGRSLNINADTAAGEIAAAMRADKLVLLTDTAGVCDASGELVHSLTPPEIADLKQRQVITGGMIPKVDCALSALSGGVQKCHIIDGRVQHAVLLEIFTDHGVGTEIVQQKSKARGRIKQA